MFDFLFSQFRLEIIKVCPNTPYASLELFLVGGHAPLPFLPVTSAQVCEYFKFYLSKPLSFDTLPPDPSALTCLLHILPFLGSETAVFHTKCVCPQCDLLPGQLTILTVLHKPLLILQGCLVSSVPASLQTMDQSCNCSFTYSFFDHLCEGGETPTG